MLNVVLVNPEIPSNTGNIARLCVGINARLHLIKPFGFTITDKKLKRAGLDYWKDLDLNIHNSLAEFLEYSADKRSVYLSTKGKILYYDFKYQDDDYFVFGSETSGLPVDLIQTNFSKCLTIPMPGKVRSINLSNAVAVVLYEAYRQLTGYDY